MTDKPAPPRQAYDNSRRNEQWRGSSLRKSGSEGSQSQKKTDVDWSLSPRKGGEEKSSSPRQSGDDGSLNPRKNADKRGSSPRKSGPGRSPSPRKASAKSSSFKKVEADHADNVADATTAEIKPLSPTELNGTVNGNSEALPQRKRRPPRDERKVTVAGTTESLPPHIVNGGMNGIAETAE